MNRHDHRTLDILDAVVRLNIETGRAVSSGLVERFLNREVSSATIRSVMKRLEDDGLLAQPHTSSGRLPTDAGFRIFVDRLLAGWSLSRHEVPAQMSRLAASGLPRLDGDLERLKAMAVLLSRLTDNISIILGPSWDTVRVLRLETYPRAAGRLLMVVILDNGRVRTGMVDLPGDHPPAVIEAACRSLSERLSGLTVAEVRAGGWESPDLLRTPLSRCTASLAASGRELLRELGEGELQIEGVGNVLDEPEFGAPEPLKALLRFIESPRTIRASLDALDRGADQDFGVWIGRENPVGGLRPFSILTGRFDLDGRPGLLAVLGPRRMSYQRAFLGIDILRRTLRAHPGPVLS